MAPREHSKGLRRRCPRTSETLVATPSRKHGGAWRPRPSVSGWPLSQSPSWMRSWPPASQNAAELSLQSFDSRKSKSQPSVAEVTCS